MRTTLTLDDDVAALLSVRQKEGLNMSFKELVNSLLRFALNQDARAQKTVARKYALPVVRGSKLLLPVNMTSTQEMLELAEGEWCK